MTFLTHQKRTLCIAVVSVFIVLLATNITSADIVDVPFGVINVGGENYYLNFTYSDGPASTHTFNNLEPIITFTTQATAETARQAIIDKYLPNDLPDTTPPMSYQGFYIPYEFNDTHFSHVFAGDKFDGNNIWDAWDLNEITNVGRNDTVVVAIAEFSPVPEPTSLLPLGIACILLLRRRRP